MNKIIPLRVAGFIFALVALGHLLRIIYEVKINVAEYVLPMSVSYIGFIVTLVLSIWMFLASSK
jgi:uncharacterized membrane protein